MRQRVILIVVYAALILFGLLVGWRAPEFLMVEAETVGGMPMTGMLILLCSVYIVAAALPFIPGAEIGLGLIAAFGAQVALLVYLCMICALGIAYALGRMVPSSWLSGRFRWLRLHRAADLVERIALLPPEDCARYLQTRMANRYLRALLTYRYVAFAILLNTPGNTVLGGGGGLALFAGMSGLFSPLRFVLTILIAVAPIPLTVYLMG